MTTAQYYNYYIDLIVINMIIPVYGLNQIIDVDEFKGHCRNIEIINSSKYLKIHGYMASIKIYQATDEAILLIQKYDLARHTISRLEVARDRICNNSLQANKLTEVFQRLHYLKWGKGTFRIDTTQYLGKKLGVKKNMYVPCYTPEEHKGKLGHRNIVHVEFVILTWKVIKSKLNIKSLYDIGKAEDHFNSLAGKYLAKATLNTKRIQKHFPGVEVNRDSVLATNWTALAIGVSGFELTKDTVI